MDTIVVKYKIPKLKFNITPSGNQTFTLHHRLIQSDADLQNTDDIGWILDGSYITNNKGVNINNVTINSLVGGYDYQIRLTHSVTGDTVYFYFRACDNTSAGDSPYYNKVLFPNQTYDWLINGVDTLMLPDLMPIDWYYSLMGHKYIDVEPEAYRSVEIYNVDSWYYCITHDIPEEKYMAFHATGANIARLPFGSGNEDADHSAASMFYKPSASVSKDIYFGMSIFLLNDYNNADFLCFRKKELYKPELIINYTDLWSLRIHNTNRSKIEVVSWNKASNIESIIETVTITGPAGPVTLDTNKWYNILFKNPKEISFYDHLGVYIGKATITNHPYEGKVINGSWGKEWSEDSPIIFGNPNGITQGLCVNRLYSSGSFQFVEEDIQEANIQKIMANYKFYPSPSYYQGGVKKFDDDTSSITSIKSNKVSIIINPDIFSKGLTPGTMQLKLLLQDGTELASKTFTLRTVEANTDTVGFDIDFENDYANAMVLLKNHFYTKHGTWGGYNGGVNSNLVYGNGKNALILENHGDLYNGTLLGVGKETDKGSNYDGYGGVAIHDAFNDTRYGQSMKTRVGSVLVSNRYFPYGEMTVRMLIPKDTYGICPALWFFHYQEYGESDNRFAYWINRGWPRQGNAEDGYYTVVNNEIDIELPSHNVQGYFNDWEQVANTYFDPNAIDTKYRIGLKQTATNIESNKIGTFELVDVANPNAFSSWRQLSYDYKTRIYPNYSSIKFNNWVGEVDSGSGYAATQARYDEEETYLALMTQAKEFSDTYADNRFHDYTIKWYPDRTELWVDDVFIRENRAFVPFNVMKYTLGGWFPTMPKRKVITDVETGAFRYEVKDTDNGGVTVRPGVDPIGTWAGINANFEILHFLIGRIKFTPYNDVSLVNLEYVGESFPESGLREII